MARTRLNFDMLLTRSLLALPGVRRTPRFQTTGFKGPCGNRQSVYGKHRFPTLLLHALCFVGELESCGGEHGHGHRRQDVDGSQRLRHRRRKLRLSLHLKNDDAGLSGGHEPAGRIIGDHRRSSAIIAKQPSFLTFDLQTQKPSVAEDEVQSDSSHEYSPRENCS